MWLVSSVLTLLGGMGSVYYVCLLGKWLEEERMGKREASLSILAGLCLHVAIATAGRGLQAVVSIQAETVMWLTHGGMILSLCTSVMTLHCLRRKCG
ncbi:hypothetical protein C1X05_04490 [Laceyella sacchari]|nr:hypothetical protein C1X05_04490 [Laceyella sacchari]